MPPDAADPGLPDRQTATAAADPAGFPGGAVDIRRPAGPALPLVFDSPHSGRQYPDDFQFRLPALRLRQAEDGFVDELFAAAPSLGATLIAARFPRSYVDPNRDETDIDTALLSAPWDGLVTPSDKTEIGVGLVWRLMTDGEPIYDRSLSPDEVRRRIETCYRPYRTAVREALDVAHRRHGGAWHINCHSMPSVGLRGRHEGLTMPDFVLGDRDGTTCEPGLRDVCRDLLTGLGFSVAINAPYKGVSLVAEAGRPGENRHSLQVEINRRLYMDEAQVAKTETFEQMCGTIDRLVATIAGYVRGRLGGGAVT